jgi:DUF917 family protein
MRILTKEDLQDYTIGSTILSTGGGGVAPSLERVGKMVDNVHDAGKKLKILDLDEVPDDAIIFSHVGTGGGVRSEMKEKWFFWSRARRQRDPKYSMDRAKVMREIIKHADREWCPLNTWSKLPEQDNSIGTGTEKGEKRLAELAGGDPLTELHFEVSPGFARLVCKHAMVDRPYIDATAAGSRAAPEIGQNCFNLGNVKPTPAVFGTTMGDLVVVEDVLCFQRLEEILEGISTYSGASTRGIHQVSVQDMKKYAFPGVESLVMKVGKQVREATKKGKSTVDATLNALGDRGFKLFEGQIMNYWQDDKYGFIWGMAKILGTGDYEGHDLKIWYKNENHVTWLDGKPWVTSPDCINVVDPETGWGLANFWPAEWETGRPVTVLGVEIEQEWETPMGLKIFGPQHFRWDIEHVPIRELVEK